MPGTKPCRWCGQPIDASAQRCHHCRTWQREGADSEEIRKAQILDQGIIYWGKFILGVLSVFGLILLGVLGFDIRNADREAQEARAQAEQAAVQATASAGALDKLVADGREELARALADAENASAALKALEDRVARLEQRVATTGAESPEQVKRDRLSVEDVAAIDAALDVLQTAAPVTAPSSLSEGSVSEGSGARRSYTVRLSVCIRAGDDCDTGELARVARVVYRLDPRWFAVADIPVVRRDNAFGYAIQVWGSTRVRACIFLVGGPTRPLIRAGTMQLGGGTAIWGKGSAGESDTCDGVRAY